MKKALIINGYERYDGVGENKLNQYLVEHTASILKQKNYKVNVTEVEKQYNPMDEHNKILDADIIFIQTPVYWFNIPGAFKTFIDRVFLIGYGSGTMTQGDGRSKDDPLRKYGSGGKLNEKKYMLSTTLSSPEIAFNDEEQFLDGLSLDDLMASVHKTLQFCGLSKLPSFAFYDVFQNPAIQEDIDRFKNHLSNTF